MKIVVIGGTGLVGSKLIKRLGPTRFADWLSQPTTNPATPHPYQPEEASA